MDIDPTHSYRFLPRKTSPPINKKRYVQTLYLASLLSGLCGGNIAYANPAIQSVNINPNPLIQGQALTISVAASPDVTQATATIDFHRSKDASFQLSLSQ